MFKKNAKNWPFSIFSFCYSRLEDSKSQQRLKTRKKVPEINPIFSDFQADMLMRISAFSFAKQRVIKLKNKWHTSCGSHGETLIFDLERGGFMELSASLMVLGLVGGLAFLVFISLAILDRIDSAGSTRQH